MRMRNCVIAGAAWMALSSSSWAHVDLDAPNGGVTLKCGSHYTVEWHVRIAHSLLNWDLWYSVTGSSGPWIPIVMDLPAGDGSVGVPHTYDWLIPDDVSNDVYVRVRMDNSGGPYFDVSNTANSIEKLSTDLGFGKVGGNGLVPTLSACGDLALGGSGGTFELVDAPPVTSTLLFLSLSSSPTPFKGGMLVPVPPAAAIPIPTSASGAISIAFPAPALPFTLYAQYALIDPGATLGVGLSNAVSISNL